ncbi:class I SAM-dependent methyltransferase [Desulfococcaceae bacterium HSG9]|nr:class I SAM-dependent methyltransferase [Desulfococcaceae bacterium HSG9]
MNKKHLCKICSSDRIEFVGAKKGRQIKKAYKVFHCLNCDYRFIINPSINYDAIYNENYYNGKGADPKVAFFYECNHPEKTIRRYEWQGIVDIIALQLPLNKTTRWLDFGCGLGGLVKWVQNTTRCDVRGYEEGLAAQFARHYNVPVLHKTDIKNCKEKFDVVTAIEVLEHVVEPLEVLKLIRACMKPGGVFFFTTGNAAKFKKNILNWGYLIPEIHVSFFEPKTIEYAFKRSGFEPIFTKHALGFEKIITYKILKNLGIKNIGLWQKLLPWKNLTLLADKKYGVTAFPFGKAV